MTAPYRRTDSVDVLGNHERRVSILEASAVPAAVADLPTATAADYPTSTALTAGVYYPSFDLGRTNAPDVFTWENRSATKFDYVGLNTDGVYRAVFKFSWLGTDPTAFIGMDVDCEIGGMRNSLPASLPFVQDEFDNTPVGELDSAAFWTYNSVAAAVNFDYDSVRDAEGPPFKISCRWYYNQANHTRLIGCGITVVRYSSTPYPLTVETGQFG